MKIFTLGVALLLVLITSFTSEISMKIEHSFNIDSLGACQGVSYQNGRFFLYGDREAGVNG